MRKTIALTVVGAAVLISGVWLIGSRIAQVRRNSAYRSAIARFQGDLPIGTPREAVRKYLDSRNIQYYLARRGENRVATYEIKIGADPGGLGCEPWDVLVALEFNTTDVLERVHMRREETCL